MMDKQQDKEGDDCLVYNLKIRQNGKYYQIGYYVKGKWNNIQQLGSAEQVLTLVRWAKDERTKDRNVPDIYLTNNV
jgi:hypothetical protein